ncbi:MAG: hypothetical protein ACRD3J_24485 [Thermoanaerobaculia bacterium]
MILYLDTSALVKLYVEEQGSVEVDGGHPCSPDESGRLRDASLI